MATPTSSIPLLAQAVGQDCSYVRDLMLQQGGDCAPLLVGLGEPCSSDRRTHAGQEGAGIRRLGPNAFLAEAQSSTGSSRPPAATTFPRLALEL